MNHGRFDMEESMADRFYFIAVEADKWIRGKITFDNTVSFQRRIA
jgi:hypothetical protein